MGVCIIFKQHVATSCHSFEFEPMVDSNAFEDRWKKKKIQEKSISVTFEGTDKFIFLFFYIWSDKLLLYLSSLSLAAAFLPARHAHASSAAFNLNSHAPFHFFLPQPISLLIPSLSLVPSDDWRWGLGVLSLLDKRKNRKKVKIQI